MAPLHEKVFGDTKGFGIRISKSLLVLCKAWFPYDRNSRCTSPRQARGRIGDGCDKWKHLLNDFADVAHETKIVRGRIGRVAMCSTLSTLADQSPYSYRLLQSRFLMET